MSYTPLTEKEVDIRRAQTRIEKWDQLASFAFTQRARDWAARKAAHDRALLQLLQTTANDSQPLPTLPPP
jgi:hypothetical protein